MAWIVGYAVTENVATATTVAEMPEHQVDDMLIAFAAKDGNGAMTETSASGWTALSSGAGAAQWIGAWWKRASSTTETAPTWTHASDESNVVVVCVRGAHTSTAPTSAIATDDTSQAGGGFLFDATYSSPSADSIVLFGMGTDSGMGPAPLPGYGQILYAGDAGTCSCGVSWQFFKSASVSVNGYRFFGAINDNMRIVAVGVPDDGNNTYEPGRVDLGSTDPVLFGGPFTGTTVVSHDTTWTSAGSNSITMLGNDWDQVWTFDGTSTYTNETTDCNDDGTGDVPLTNAVGACIYFGSDEVFDSFAVDVGTAGTGSPVVVWEYWSNDAGAWATLPIKVMVGAGATWNSNFTVAGSGVIRFTPPEDWVATSVNSVSEFYVRQRVTTTWTAAPTLDQSLKDGRPLIYAASTAIADSGVNPYWGGVGTSPASQTTTPANQGGGEYVATATQDMSANYLLTSYRFTNKRDSIDNGYYNQHKGVSLTLMDANAENRRTSWIIAAKDSPDVSGDKRSVIGIQPTQTEDTAWARHGNLAETAIDTVIFAASAPFGATRGSGSMLFKVGEQVLAGGMSTSPLTFEQMIDAFVKGTQLFPILDQQGALADVWHPIKIGGGDDVHVDINLKTFQFPTRASAANKTTHWHVDDNKIWIDFDARSGDTCKFTNCLFIGGSSYLWKLNSSASASATWDFDGTTVVGAAVTLRAVVDFVNMAFTGCRGITLNGATVEDTSITDGLRADGALTMATATEAGNLARLTFADNHNGDIGHSVEILAAGTYTFDGHLFSGGGPAHFGFHTINDVDAAADEVDHTGHGYATGDAIWYEKNGGSDAIGLTGSTMYYVRAVTADSLAFYTTKANAIADTSRIALSDGSTGQTHYIYSAKADVYISDAVAVTISVINDGDTPTVRGYNNATITVTNNKTLTLTNLIAGSEVRIFRISDGVELDGIESSGTSFVHTYNYVSDVAVKVIVQKTNYQWLQLNVTLGSTNATQKVLQAKDYNYVNP